MTWLRRLLGCRHEPLLVQQFDPDGKRTGAIEWTCIKCLRVVGTTKLKDDAVNDFEEYRRWRLRASETRRVA